MKTKTDIISFYQPDVIAGVKACIQADESVLLIGETGLGKTTLIKALADEQKKNLVRVSVNGSTSADEILGKWGAKEGSTFWNDGILIQAMKRGDWIVFDEINAALPEVMFALHSLLDDDRRVTLIEKDGEVIRPEEGFRFFGTMNPSDDYAGTKDMNMAFMSRFAGVFYIEPYEMTKEIEILESHKVSRGTAEKLVSLANGLRDMKKTGTILYFCSTRDIVQAGKLTEKGLEIKIAVQGAILNKMTKDEQKEVLSGSVVNDFVDKGKIYETEKEKALDKELKEVKNTLKETQKESSGFADQVNKLKDKIKELEANPVSALPTGLEDIEFDEKTIKALKTLGIAKKKTK